MPFIGEIPSLQKNTADRAHGGDLEQADAGSIRSDIPRTRAEKAVLKRGIFCYITTAVCRSMDKADNCYELTTLREYRDGYLLRSEADRRS